MAFFSGLQRGFGRAIDPRQIAMARALAEAQDAFERRQDHEIARQRARETGRDYRDVLREMRGLAPISRRRPPAARPPARVAPPAAPAKPRDDPRPPAPYNERVLHEKLRQSGGINGLGYVPAPQDQHELARLIYAESLDIPKDFEAIGWAIVNRVNREGFRRTLPEVIHQPDQFETVPEGNKRRVPHENYAATERPELLDGVERDRWRYALDVADGILTGRIQDPTGGANYFFSSEEYRPENPETALDGFFRAAVTSGRLRPSKYRSVTDRRRRNHFLIDNEQARRIR